VIRSRDDGGGRACPKWQVLSGSRCFGRRLFSLTATSRSPVVRAIEEAVEEIPRRRGVEVNVELSHVRHALRERLQPNLETRRGYFPWLARVVEATQDVGVSLIAMLGMAIPLFLTPRRGLDLASLPATTRVQIHFGRAEPEASWTITPSETGEPMFTFDLPAEVGSDSKAPE